MMVVPQSLRHFGIGLTETFVTMMVMPQSLNRASVFSMCFLEEFTDYDMLISRILDIAPYRPHSAFDLLEVFVFEIDRATPHDAYVDEMDMIGTGCILDI